MNMAIMMTMMTLMMMMMTMVMMHKAFVILHIRMNAPHEVTDGARAQIERQRSPSPKAINHGLPTALS